MCNITTLLTLNDISADNTFAFHTAGFSKEVSFLVTSYDCKVKGVSKSLL